VLRPRRDRRGRGARGPLAPAAVPLARTRRDTFDDWVLDAVERLERSIGPALAEVEIAVEEVPPDDRVDPHGDPVPLGRAEPPGPGRPGRLVVYRRPVELRSTGGRDRAALVHDVVVEQVADLLGVPPEQVDPGYAAGESDDG